MSDWQPIKTEDLVRLYREGWTLKLLGFDNVYSKHDEKQNRLFLTWFFTSDKWLGKPPEKKWKVVGSGMTFLTAMHWLEAAPDGMRRLRRAGLLIEIVAHQGMPCWVTSNEVGDACVFDLNLVSATDWEGLEEVAP